MVGGFLFPDSSGNTISWMWLPIIEQEWETIATYSWGSATLAWLCRQMCDACRRSGATDNLGGCVYLLQLWMWERLPIVRYGYPWVPTYQGLGRPRQVGPAPHEDPPT